MDVKALTNPDSIRIEILRLIRLATDSAPKEQVRLVISSWYLNPDTVMDKDDKSTIGNLLNELKQTNAQIQVNLSNHYVKLLNLKALLRLRSMGVPANYSRSAPLGTNHEKVVALSIGDTHYLILGSAEMNNYRLHDKGGKSYEIALMFKIESPERPQTLEEYFKLFSNDQFAIYYFNPLSSAPHYVSAQEVFEEVLKAGKKSIEFFDQFGLIKSTGLGPLVARLRAEESSVSMCVPRSARPHHFVSQIRRRRNHPDIPVNIPEHDQLGRQVEHRKAVIAIGDDATTPRAFIGTVNLAKRSFYGHGQNPIGMDSEAGVLITDGHAVSQLLIGLRRPQVGSISLT